MVRFFLIFFVVMAGLFVFELTPPGQMYFVEPLTSGLARASAFWIELFGRELAVDGIIMVDKATGFAIQIVAGCNGVEAMILLTAAIAAISCALALSPDRFGGGPGVCTGAQFGSYCLFVLSGYLAQATI